MLWFFYLTCISIISSHTDTVNAIRNISQIGVISHYTTNRNCSVSKSDGSCIKRDDVIIKASNFVECGGPLKQNERKSNVISFNTSQQTLLPNALLYERHLESTSIIFQLAKFANLSRLNADCYLTLRQIEQGILRRVPWAMKVLDASGTKPAGFIFGQNFWLGSRQACETANKPLSITLSKDYERNMSRGLLEDVAPFDMEYRVIYLHHNSPWQVEIKLMTERIIHIGLCLPRVCHSTEIQQHFQECLNGERFPDLTGLFETQAKVLYMKNLKLSESFVQKKTFKLFLTFMVLTCLMMLTGSFMNANTSDDKKDKIKCLQKNQEDKSSLDVNQFENIKSFIKCYDLVANWSRLFAIRETTKSEIAIINGLRSIAAIWVMLFHVLWYMYFTVNNKPFMISHAEQPFFQYVSSAPLLVDVFFTISGFLQTFNFLRNFQLIENIRQNNFRQNIQKFLAMLVHRYLRLAPLCFVIMIVVDLLSAYTQDISVFHIHDRFDQTCSRHWWRNIIFIQNFFDHEEMCVNWTWSLACEMQFFILATVLLFIYVKYSNIVKTVVVVALPLTIVWSYICGMAANFQISFDATFATGTQIYINPFVRILPYILGAITGWFLIEHRDDITLSAIKEKCLWNLTILTFFSCIYSTFRRDISSFTSITLFIFGRMFFSSAVCWMIIGSATGCNIWWSRILEASLFQHFNRLTYAFYLLNPLIIGLFFSLSETSTHVDPLMLCALATGFVVIVYIASIGFTLAFEMPYSNWSSLMLKPDRVKRNVN